METSDLAPELSDQDRLLLVFGYLGPLALFSLVASRREFVKWHAKQGLVLSAVLAAVYFVLKGIELLLERLLWKLLADLFWIGAALVGLGVALLLLLCIVRALEGERFKVPLIGELVDYF